MPLEIDELSFLPIKSIVAPSSTVTAHTEAPKSKSSCTVSRWPFSAAICRAVIPPSAGLSIIWPKTLEMGNEIKSIKSIGMYVECKKWNGYWITRDQTL